LPSKEHRSNKWSSEDRAYGLLSDDSAFWNRVAIYLQRAIIIEAKAVALDAVGEDIGEANELKVTSRE
jgi:hypothetical protein